MATTAPNSAGPVAPGGVNTPNAATAYSFLRAKGLSAAQASGVIANLIAESGINPESWAKDSNGLPSVGIASWNNNTTAQHLVTGNPTTDLDNQLQYLWAWIQSNPSAYLQLKGTSTPYQAGSVFANLYERCAACGYQDGSSQLVSRGGIAQQVYTWATDAAISANSGLASILDPFAISGVGNAPGTSGGIVPSVTGAASGTLPSLIGGAGTLLGDLTSAAFWERLGLFVLGAVLTLLGVSLFVAESKTAQTVGTAALVA
jgi:hypothetical protein